MADDNLEPFIVPKGRAPEGYLLTIPETRASSRAPTRKRSREARLCKGKASASKRPRVSEAHESSKTSESTVEIQPERANWTFKGRLAKFGGI
jgi:hypothetical protein